MSNNPIRFNDPLGDTIRTYGDRKNANIFLQFLSKSTGNTYSLSKGGDIVRINKNLNTKSSSKQSAILSKIVETMITDKGKTVDLNFTATNDPANKQILFDRYSKAQIDVGDYKRIKNDKMMAAMLAHPLVEYYNAPPVAGRLAGTYEAPHKAATAVESQIMFEMGGYQPAGYGFRSNLFSGDGKTVSNIDFLYGNEYFTVSTTPDNKGNYTGEIISDIK